MKTISLENGQWRLRQIGKHEWIPVTVPGEVHIALLAAGKIPDPFVADNELHVQWVVESDWMFEGLIEVSDYLLGKERAWLEFDGLDTLAQVSLNGTILGEAVNAFRTYRWEVSDLLAPGKN